MSYMGIESTVFLISFWKCTLSKRSSSAWQLQAFLSYAAFLAPSKTSLQWHDHSRIRQTFQVNSLQKLANSGTFQLWWNCTSVEIHLLKDLHRVLQLSILWDLSHTERAVVTQDPTFWAPHSWKDLRDLFIKVWYLAVPSVSIQCLAPERNLWCQIKHRSFLGSAGVQGGSRAAWHGRGKMPVLASRKWSGEECSREPPLSEDPS